MCGIAGILDTDVSSNQLEEKARQMMQSLEHRGPDEDGLWRSDSCNLILAHRRLAIQDLSANGAQPMHSASKKYCIAFNGEIYNFKDIASILSKSGHIFSGHSDTEVLLAAIEQWGITNAINRFVGMFAFALWDRDKRTLHLCRDRLGEKPLYYGWLGNTFYFASELKAIEKVAPPQQLVIDHEGLSGFLKYGYISAPHSIYHNIYKLMPGTVLSLPVSSGKKPVDFTPCPNASTLSPKPYWSALESANQGLSNLILDEHEAVEQLDRTLHQAIRQQMIADVKVGTFLSGGIDSTVVSAIAQAESSTPIRTYTIGFSEKEYDESVYAEKIAKHLGTEHLTMNITPDDVLQTVPELATIYDEPFADSSQIPSFLVSKLAREHVTVCLSGDGGDELFAGYNRYLWTQSLWGKLSNIPGPARRLIGAALGKPSPAFWDGLYQTASRFKSNDFNKQKLVGLKVQKLAGFMQQKDIYQAYDYLMSYWHDPAALMTDSATAQMRNLKYPKTDNFVDQAMYMDQIGYLPGDNLAKVDRASMAVSLETRLPLLSRDVVDLSWRIPTSMKVRNNTSKWALREVLYKYVPQEMIDRPKMGFSVPVARWLRGELKEWAGDLLSNADLHSGSTLQKNLIQKAWTEHASGKRDHSHRLWTVLMYLSWRNSRNLN